MSSTDGGLDQSFPRKTGVANYERTARYVCRCTHLKISSVRKLVDISTDGEDIRLNSIARLRNAVQRLEA